MYGDQKGEFGGKDRNFGLCDLLLFENPEGISCSLVN